MGNNRKRTGAKDKPHAESKKSLRAKVHAPTHRRGLSPTIAALLLVSVVLVSGGVYVYNFVEIDVTDVIDTIQKRVAVVLGNEPDAEPHISVTPAPPPEEQIPTQPPSPTQPPTEHNEEPDQTDNADSIEEEERLAKEEEIRKERERKAEEIRKEEKRKEEEERKKEEIRQEQKRKEEEERKKEEIRKEEERKKEEIRKEQKRKEEEERKKEEIRKEEERKKEEIRKEEKRKEEEERKKEEIRKEEERKKEEIRKEEKRKEEEERKEEEIRKEEDRKKEEIRKEEKRKEEDKRKKEEIRKEEERKKEEIRKEEKRKEEEEIKKEDERKKEEIRKEEQRKEEEDRKKKEVRKEEERKRDEARKEEEREKDEARKEEDRQEEQTRKEEEERKKIEEQFKAGKKQMEEKQKAILKKEQEEKEKEERKSEEDLKKTKERQILEEEKKNYAKASITNDADYLIRKELDDADTLVDNKNPVEAIKSYEKILTEHPGSARAIYGIAWATDIQSELERSNDLLEKAVEEYLKVINLQNVPKELLLKAGKRCADRQKFRGWGFRALKTLQSLVDLYPDDVTLTKELGVHSLIIGKNEEARTAFKKALVIDPDDGFALVHIGFIIKQIDHNYEESIPYLQKGIDSNAAGTVDGRFFFHLGDAYYRIGHHDRAYEVYELGAQKGVFYSKYQRSLYNVDGLTARPWWTAEQTGQDSLIKMLEENWKTIRDEGLAQLDAKTGKFVAEEEDLRESGDWKQFTLYQQGRKMGKNCEKAPKTCEIIEQFPDAKGCKRGQVKFSVMEPGVHVWPHCGPTNCRIRSHLGLVIPDGVRIRVTEDTREWKEGKVIIFDDSFEHEVWHEGTSTRLVLIVDMWHPDLTARQKANLTPI